MAARDICGQQARPPVWFSDNRHSCMAGGQAEFMVDPSIQK